jgi:hypothetical protein
VDCARQGELEWVHWRDRKDHNAVSLGTYFTTLGVNASIGRTLTDADDSKRRRSSGSVVSNAYWQRRLGGDKSVLNKTITIDEVTYSIIGVTPRDFFGTKVGQARTCGFRWRWKRSYRLLTGTAGMTKPRSLFTSSVV